MNIDELNNSKTPLVRITKNLDKFKGKVLFKEKLALANHLLSKAVLPEVKNPKI